MLANPCMLDKISYFPCSVNRQEKNGGQEMAQQVTEVSIKHVRLGLSPCDSMLGGEN